MPQALILCYALPARLRHALQQALSRNYVVRHSRNVRAVIALASNTPPPLILLALGGPHAHTGHATQLLQQGEIATSQLFVLALSPQAEQEAALLRLGVADYVDAYHALDALCARITARLPRRTAPQDGKLTLPALMQQHGSNPSSASRLPAHIAAVLIMQHRLRAALALQQFLLHFQPQVDLHSGRMTAAEALLRWQHPERGLMTPDGFIGLAEHTELILPIGLWVIDAVCRQQALWKQQGLSIVPVALNLSALQFRNQHLLEDILQALARYQLDPAYIELELTETLLMQDPVKAAKTMHAMRAAGLHLSLDDFGTGYSSLAYLKRYPFSAVKMDRSFVTELATGATDAVIAQTIISMGHSLNLTVIAEGVETLAQLQWLRASGCDQVQGYYFSKPVPAAAFARMLQPEPS